MMMYALASGSDCADPQDTRVAVALAPENARDYGARRA